MSPLPDPHAQQAVASPIPPHLVSRLLGTETGDAFARQVSLVVEQLTAQWARTDALPLVVPSKLGLYLVGASIGRGGMGAVHRGVHEKTGRVVALKMAPSGTKVGQFLHAEALALGGLDHRGVVQIFDHGEEQGIVWLAMQFVSGATIATLMRERWATHSKSRAKGLTAAELRESVMWFRDLAIALQAIHERGVVHRDVKPANLMIAKDGTAYLIDFGLSLETAENAVVDSVAGTVPYMSPEQVLVLSQLDGRSDVYSLAACLFEFLSGRRLVGEEEPRVGLLRQVAFANAPKLSSVAPWVDRSYDAVIAKALAKDPEHRYRDARAFAEDLSCLLEGKETVHARTTWGARTWKHRYRIGVVLVVLAASGFFGVRAWQRHAAFADMRAAIGRAEGLGREGADEGVRVLSRALELAPRYAADGEFQDIYQGALQSFAPLITKRMFQRAAFVPSNVAGSTPAGAIGVMARRHLATATTLPEATRAELVIQAMFVDLLAHRPKSVLAIAEAARVDDPRVRQLVAVTHVIADDPVDPSALAWAHSREYANLEPDELCCRALLLLELSAERQVEMRDDLRALSDALERAITPTPLNGEAGSSKRVHEGRNFLVCLQAATHLALGEAKAAEDLMVGRLVDTGNAPSREEHPALLMMAAAARLRGSAQSESSDGSDSRVVAERFLSAAEMEPGLIAKFVRTANRNVNADKATLPSFNRETADFFEALLERNPPARFYSSAMVGLLRFAVQDWCARHACETRPLVMSDWEPFLRVAESVAGIDDDLVFDAIDEDVNFRWLFSTAIHIVGQPHFLASSDREHILERCQRFHDAALRLLPSPQLEVPLALAGVQLTASPQDEAARSRFQEAKRAVDAAVQSAQASQADSSSLDMLLEEQSAAVALEAAMVDTQK